MNMEMIRKSPLRILIMMVAVIFIASNVYAIDAVDFSVTRSIIPEHGKVVTGQEFTVKYLIQPKNIPAGTVRQKEIVLVIDTSGSMNTTDSGATMTRMEAARQAATSFVQQFDEYDNVKIGIVEYNYRAEEVIDLTLASNSSLITEISGLNHGGWTNMGDGIRKGYYMLEDGGSTSNTDKYLIFMTDGYANTASYKSGNMVYSSRSNGYDYSWYNGVQYAKNWTELLDPNNRALHPSGFSDSTMKIKPYFIAFSNSASSLYDIAHDTKGTSDTSDDVKRVAELEFQPVGTASALVQYYNDIAEEIQKAIDVNVHIQDSFVGSIDFVGVDPTGFSSSIPTSSIVVSSITGGTQVKSPTDGWPITYTYVESTNEYVATPIEIAFKIKATDAGRFTLGQSGSSIIQFTNPNSPPTTKPIPETSFESFTVNPPTINMTQEGDSADRTFTLSYEGLDNILFDGNDETVKDYITFNDTWSDGIFGPSSNNWTISAVIEPKVLDGTYTSEHGVENVFLSKSDAGDNDLFELGIVSTGPDAGKLQIYLNTVGKAETITVGDGELIPGVQHDVAVAFDNGVLTAYIDGYKHVVNDFSGRSMSTLSGTEFMIGSSDNDHVFYNGKINEIAVYSDTYSAQDIYDGTTDSEKLEAHWTAKGSTISQLVDSTTHGRHSNSIYGTNIQGDPLGTGENDINATVSLQYKIGDTGSWEDYSLTDVIPALSTPGEVTIYARSILTGSGFTVTSVEAEKTAKLADNDYVRRITLAPNPSDIEVDESYTMTYTLEGDTMGLYDKSASTIYLNDIDVEFTYPSSTTVRTLPAGFTDNGSVISGRISGATMQRQSSIPVDGKYQYKFVSETVDIVYEPVSTSDINFSADSAKSAYTDFYGKNVTLVDGDSKNINVRPNAPTVEVVDGDGYLDQVEAVNVEIKGTADPNTMVYITVTDGTTTRDGSVVTPIDYSYLTTTTDGSGHYTFRANFSEFAVGVPIDITAMVEDGDTPSDKSYGYDTSEKLIHRIDVDIK